jgi:hypothetical protein
MNADQTTKKEPLVTAEGMYPVAIKSKIIRYFPETNLRSGHKGLAELAKKHKINVKELAIGEYCIFTNKSKTAIKMYAAGNVVAHYKDPNNRRLNSKVIKILPLFFNGKEINYDAALESVMKKEFPNLQ